MKGFMRNTLLAVLVMALLVGCAPVKLPVVQESTMLSCNEGGLAYGNDMTDIQWASYTESLVGKPITFCEEVWKVTVEGIVFLHQCSWHNRAAVLFGIPFADATNLVKGQLIQGTGLIREIAAAPYGLNVIIDITEWYIVD